MKLTQVFFFCLLNFSLYSQTQFGSDIDAEAAGDNSGSSVALSSSGNLVAVGAKRNDGTAYEAGHVRIYQKSPNGWSQLGADIDGEAYGDMSGTCVSFSKDSLVVAIGAPLNDGNGMHSGHVRVYQYSSGSWTQLGTDIDGEASGDESGASVSLSGDGTILAIGAYYNDGTGNEAGHVRVYQYSSGSWSQMGSDIDGEAVADWSGSSVSLSNDGLTLAVGATLNDGGGSSAGHVRVYQFSSGSWSQIGSDIDGEAAGDQSGYSVSLSHNGTVLAVGAPYNDGTGTDAGHVKVYQLSSGTWSQIGSDIDGEAAGDNSGFSVSLSNDGQILAVGAISNDGTGNDAGHVRVYQYDGGSWMQVGTDIDGEAAADNSGNTISLSSDGTMLSIGAIGNDGSGNGAGHVRIFSIPICYDSIQQQPQSNTFYTVPGTAYFSVSHSDTAATYQWQQNSGSGWTNLSNLGIYSGVTTDSLELNGITSALNNFGYRCIIGSCNSDTTDTSILTVLISCQDSIQQQPQSSTFYTIPGSAYFSTTHSDTAATYQWQQNNGTGWVDLGDIGIYSGTTTDSLVFNGITSSLNNFGYRCIIGSCNSDTTDVAILTVLISCQDSIQQQPQSNTFYTVPGTAYFGVMHSDTTATYQWQQNSGTGWIDLVDLGIYSGTSTDSLLFNGITTAIHNYSYRCLINSCNSDTTVAVNIGVIDNINIEESSVKITVSPNPTGNFIRLTIDKSYSYKIFNTRGTLVKDGMTEGFINLNDIASGSYILELISEYGSVERIIIHKV